MGWQSVTKVARFSLSFRERESTLALIKEGRAGSDFARGMASVLPSAPDQFDKDNWGPQFAACTGPAKSTTDEMWQATMALLSIPCARAHLNVVECDFSEDHPAAGGIWVKWIVMDTALLRSFLREFQEAEHHMPKDMWRVLNGAHEYDDGQGGRWQTVIIKHTVV